MRKAERRGGSRRRYAIEVLPAEGHFGVVEIAVDLIEKGARKMRRSGWRVEAV